MYEFDGEISVLEGKIKWSVVYFPHPVKTAFQTDGRVPVTVTVDGHAFDHMLLPSKKGHYFVYNEFLRRAVKKKPGETVHVTLKKDESKREVAIPDDIAGVLKTGGALKGFLAQPDYIKREQINFIELAKKEETRSNRMNALVAKITNGNSEKKG